MESLPSSPHSAANPAEKPHDAPSGGGRRTRIFTLIFLGCSLVCLIFGGLWIGGIMPGMKSHTMRSSVAQPVYVAVPEIVTNLQGNEGEEPYVKMKVMLELPASSDRNNIKKKMPQFVDMFQTYIRSMHPSELQGATGTYRLKEALLSRANIIAAPNSVIDILFQEIIVQ